MSLRTLWLLLGFLSILVSCTVVQPSKTLAVTTVVTPPYTMQGLVRAHGGPRTSQEFTLSGEFPELVWITGAKVSVVDAEGQKLPGDFLSEASVALVSAQRHATLHKRKYSPTPILFAFCTDVSSVQLPSSYGIPMFSNEILMSTVQWKNGSPYGKARDVALKFELTYSREPLRPIAVHQLSGLALLNGDSPYFELEKPDPNLHGTGSISSDEVPGSEGVVDSFGRKFGARWWVPQGEQESSTWLGSQIQIPLDVVMAVGFHHQNLSYLELVDYESDKKKLSWNREIEGGFEPMAFSPPLHLNEDGQYGLRALLQNSSRVRTVGLAGVYLYILDRADGS